MSSVKASGSCSVRGKAAPPIVVRGAYKYKRDRDYALDKGIERGKIRACLTKIILGFRLGSGISRYTKGGGVW